jgi:hypothetical protein
MSAGQKTNGLATASAWREAARSDREARAQRLELPSGAVILAAKPEPMEWILSGRIPQRLLGAAIQPAPGSDAPEPARVMTRDEVIELANFAVELVKASVVEPRIGEGDDEIPFEEIPIEDRAFIFEWACRALGHAEATREGRHEEASIPSRGIERFRAK